MNGIRVIDLTRVLAGPWATQQMADHGADVLKVEPPSGDETRHFQPQVHKISTYFAALNRNKRSIALDLNTSEGQEILTSLLSTADILVENYRAGVMDKWGLSAETIQEHFPNLIVIAIRPFPESDQTFGLLPGYDILLQGLSGACASNGFAGSPPLRHSWPIADLFTGQSAFQAALLALLHRERTGEAQRIVVNMAQVMAAASTYHGSRFLNTGQSEEMRGNEHRGIVPYGIFACEDGWVSLACGNNKIWERLCAALCIEPIDEWRSNEDRVRERTAVHNAIEESLARQSVVDAVRTLNAHRVPAQPIWTIGEFLQSSLVKTQVVTCGDTEVTTVAPPFESLTSTTRRHLPKLNDHTS